MSIPAGGSWKRAQYTAVAAGWRADGTGVAVVLLMDGSYFVSAFTDPNENVPAPRNLSTKRQ